MQNFSKYLLGALIISIILFIAWYLKTIVLYITIAVIISFIGQPLVTLFSKIRYKKIKLSQGICAALALATLTTIVILFISLFIPLVVEEARIISKINPNEVISTFKEPLKNLEYDLQKFKINYGNGESIEKFLANQLTSVLGFNQVSAFAQGIFGFTAQLIGAIFSILFMAFFFIKDKNSIYNIILLLTPTKYTNTIKDILKDTKRLLTKYFIGIVFDMLFVATITAIGLSFIGIGNALLIGVFAGLMNIIPYIGPIIALLFGVLIGSTTNLNLEFYTQLLPLIEKIVLVFIIVQIIDALFFQPFVISNTVKAHPLEIFLIILIAGTFAGIGGMVVAVPIYTILRILAKEFLNNFRFVQKLTENLDKN